MPIPFVARTAVIEEVIMVWDADRPAHAEVAKIRAGATLRPALRIAHQRPRKIVDEPEAYRT